MQTIAISILLAKHINDIIKGKKTIIESNLEVDMKILISGHKVEIIECSQLILAKDLNSSQYLFSDSFGVSQTL